MIAVQKTKCGQIIFALRTPPSLPLIAAEELTMPKMPALFIGHGSPMNSLEHNGCIDVWRQLGAALQCPRGILVVSERWFVGLTVVTAMPRSRTIHDQEAGPRAGSVIGQRTSCSFTKEPKAG